MDKQTKWGGEGKETSEIKNSGEHALSYGFDMDRWINKRSGEVKGRKHQKSRIQESMRFPMVLKWKGGSKRRGG